MKKFKDFLAVLVTVTFLFSACVTWAAVDNGETHTLFGKLGKSFSRFLKA